MKPPPRLRDGDDEAARLLDEARPIRGWREDERRALYRRIAASAGRRAPSRRWLVALVAVPAAAAAIAAIARRAPVEPPQAIAPAPAPAWRALDVGGGARIEAAPSAVAQAAPSRVEVRRGELRGASDGPLAVVTPYLRLQVGGASFHLSVTDGLTELVLENGTAVASTPGHAALRLTAPATLRSDDARLARTDEQALPRCRALAEVAARAACYEEVAAGDGLDAQNAAYTLGLIARDELHDSAAALARFRDYQRRFPRGVLAPEAARAVVAELVAARRFAEACRAAERYQADFPDDGRAVEVALVRARLLRDELHAPADALAAYQAILAREPPAAQAEEALFAVGLCQRDLGRGDDARATFAACRARFPRGAHADEIARLLDE